MVPGARQPRRLLQLLQRDTNANVREVANRPACADMLRAIDAGEPSTPAGCAEAWLVLEAMANVPLADQAEPPLYDDDFSDEASVRRRLDRGAIWDRQGSAFDWCVLRMAHMTHEFPHWLTRPRSGLGHQASSLFRFHRPGVEVKWWCIVSPMPPPADGYVVITSRPASLPP